MSSAEVLQTMAEPVADRATASIRNALHVLEFYVFQQGQSARVGAAQVKRAARPGLPPVLAPPAAL